MKVTSGLVTSQQQQQLQYGLGQHIRRLDFGSFINDTIFMLFLPHAHCLEELILQHAPLITDRSLQHLPRQCPNLIDFYLTASPITTSSIVSLGQYCHQLTCLSLQDCRHLSSDIFAALVDCPLESLTVDMANMHHLEQNDNDSTSTNNNSRVMKTALDLAALRRLTYWCLWDAPTRFLEQVTTLKYDRQGNATWPLLATCIFGGDNMLDDLHAITFIQSHTSLIDLCLGSTIFTDALLYRITTHLPRVQSLVIYGNVNITPSGLQHLSQQCPLLRHVNVF